MIETNANFAKTNKTFQTACEIAGVKPTKRQASKYRMGKGLAIKITSAQITSHHKEKAKEAGNENNTNN
jgi:hypothetical protein